MSDTTRPPTTSSRVARRAAGFALGALGVLALLAPAAFSSNMAFKLNVHVGADESFGLALPWNNGYPDAAALLNDFSGTPHDSSIVRSVSRVTPATTLVTWVYGGSPEANFELAKADLVVLQTGANGLTTFVAGSHDPNLVLRMPPDSAFGLAVPYHGTHQRVGDLLDDIAGIPHNPAIANAISRFTPFGRLSTWIYAGVPSSNFLLVPGEGVIVHTGSEGVEHYVYPHY